MADDEVHTVDYWWDGPREGVATFEGRPHYYECIFDDEADDWTERFCLTPIAEDIVRIALEAREIWYGEGSEHRPYQAADEARYRELRIVVETAVKDNANAAFEVIGDFSAFRGLRPHSPLPVRVVWSRT